MFAVVDVIVDGALEETEIHTDYVVMAEYIEYLCKEFTAFNPSFDAVKFTEACGF